MENTKEKKPTAGSFTFGASHFLFFFFFFLVYVYVMPFGRAGATEHRSGHNAPAVE